jgi:biopolymer transport protein ExbD
VQPLELTIHGDGSIDVARGATIATVTRTELARTLRPLLEATRTERVVFVDPADEVAYADAVSVMDTVLGMGADRVALKLRAVALEEPAH